MNKILDEKSMEASSFINNLWNNIPEDLKNNKYACLMISAAFLAGAVYQVTDACKANKAMDLNYDYSSSLFSSKCTRQDVLTN